MVLLMRQWSLCAFVGIAWLVIGAQAWWLICTPSNCPPGPIWAAFDTTANCTGEVVYYTFLRFETEGECEYTSSPFWDKYGRGTVALFEDRIEQIIHFNQNSCPDNSTSYQKEIWHFGRCARTGYSRKRIDDNAPFTPILYFDDISEGQPLEGSGQQGLKRAMKAPSQMNPNSTATVPSSGMWIANVNATYQVPQDTTLNQFAGVIRDADVDKNGTCSDPEHCVNSNNKLSPYWLTTHPSPYGSNSTCEDRPDTTVATYNLVMGQCYNSQDGQHYQRFCTGDDPHTSGHHVSYGNPCERPVFTQIYRDLCSPASVTTIWCFDNSPAPTVPEETSHASTLSTSITLLLAIMAMIVQ